MGWEWSESRSSTPRDGSHHPDLTCPASQALGAWSARALGSGTTAVWLWEAPPPLWASLFSSCHWMDRGNLITGVMTARRGFPCVTSGKEPACQCWRHKRHEFDPWVGKIPWTRAWQPTPVSLPGESHGQRSLTGYSPWGHKELDTTEVI